MSSYQYPDTLPVTTTGGWARPGWWDILADADKEGRFGPADRKELFDDYASEYRFLRARTDRRPKIGLPGPYGITTELDFSPGIMLFLSR